LGRYGLPPIPSMSCSQYRMVVVENPQQFPPEDQALPKLLNEYASRRGCQLGRTIVPTGEVMFVAAWNLSQDVAFAKVIFTVTGLTVQPAEMTFPGECCGPYRRIVT